MSMSASTVAMMIGAESTTMRTVAEGKIAVGGKLFAASFDERIAAEPGTGTEMTVPQSRTDLHAVKNGLVKGIVYDPYAIEERSQKPVVSPTTALMPESKRPAILSCPVQQAIVMTSVVKAQSANAPSVAVVQETQLSPVPAVRDASVENNDQVDGDVKLLVENRNTDPIAVKHVSGDQLLAAKLQSPGVMQEIANDDGNVMSARTSSANVQLIQHGSHIDLAKAKRSIASASEENGSSAKDSAKKDSLTTAATPQKTTDITTNVENRYTSSPRMCGVTVVLAPSIPWNTTCSKPQSDMQPSTLQGIAPAAATGEQGHVLMAETSQRSESQRGASTEKPSGDGSGVSTHPNGEAHAAGKTDQAIQKPAVVLAGSSAPLATSEMAKSSAKLLSTEVATPGSHPDRANAAMASLPGGGTALILPASLPQKNPSGNFPSSVIATHGSNGELPGISASALITNEIHKTLVSTPTVLEIGIPNGTQGWLKVRAELTGGGVNATLSTASATGQEMLHRELPSLTAYLQQESVPVKNVVINVPSGAGLPSFFGGNSGGAGRHAQHEQERSTYLEAPPVGNGSYDEAGMTNTDGVLSAAQQSGGGNWLSVRA